MVKGRFDLGGLFSAFQMRFTEHLAIGHIDYFVTAWPDLKQRLLNRSRRIKSENIEIILNGVDISSKPQNRSECGQNSHVFLVIYAGSYGKIEGVEPLIVKHEKLNREDIHFEFIGFQEKDSKKKREIQEKLGVKVTLVDWLHER